MEEMARTRNSDDNAPATAVVGSSVAQGRAKKVPAKKKSRPAKATQLPQARQTEQVSMEAFASVVGFAKILEGKKQKRRVERDQNKKAQTTGWFNGSIGSGNQGMPSKGSLVPAQSMPQTSGSLPGRHSQGKGSQSR
ncbi:hypothetical protein HAX54_048839 [Datura stramonium]|uniref:Uncharacterized protein n=1 Tax=Datura stramonium TaxID=4076 RepID=A0ABS8WJR8_DATST|nr:hypothetical protein [Datura stramonium]